MMERKGVGPFLTDCVSSRAGAIVVDTAGGAESSWLGRESWQNLCV